MRTLLCVLLIALPSLAQAQISARDCVVSSAGGDLLVLPDGSGPTLASAGATITLQVVDVAGAPVPNVPAQDMWLENRDGVPLSACAPLYADAATDAEGRTTFSGSLALGGYTGRDPDKDPVDDVGGGNDQLEVVIQGQRVDQYDNSLFREVRYKSPDYTGNLSVDLGDIAVLAYELGRPGSWRSDFNHDGSVDLADIGTFVSALGLGCP